MGEPSKYNRVVKTVDHPWARILIALMSTGAFAGVGTGFWNYMKHRERTALESRQTELEAARATKDLQLQISAIMELMAEQGKQLKQFKEAVEKLTVGHRAIARAIVKDVEIPLSQGKMILRGRAVPAYEAVEMEQMAISDELSEVEGMLEKR